MFRAQEQAFPILADVLKTFPQFPFVMYAANASWAKAQSPTLVAFMKANIASLQWLYDPKNRAHAIDILARATNSPPEDAEKTYAYYITQIALYPVDGRITPAKMTLAIDAVMRFGLIKTAPAPASLYDDSYVEAANTAMRIR